VSDPATTLRRIARAMRGMSELAVEKISEATREDPFQVLIATLLSAQTKDAVTHAASTRLFAAANTPAAMAKLSAVRVEKLIYPVSFYRNKAVHVRASCRKIVADYGGVVPDTPRNLVQCRRVGISRGLLRYRETPRGALRN
jgi:endonuclease III